MRSSSWKDRLGAALSPGAEMIELRQRRTDENDHVVLEADEWCQDTRIST
jgi:hypothetical protein